MIENLQESGEVTTSNQPRAQTNTTPSNPQRVYVVRNSRSDSPNLTFNCHISFNRRGLYAVAMIGAVTQALVLAYSGLITYHPAWKQYFLKDDGPVASFAYPTMATGTLFLVIGIFFCACVVETSTEEEHYKVAKGYKAYIVWLQRSVTVSDQDFKPCAIYPVCEREYITFSHRRTEPHDTRSKTPKPNHDKTHDQGTTSSQKKPSESDQTTAAFGLEFLTIIGAVTSLMGFAFQFIGLREMNWSASISQLVAIALMTILRALVRRNHDTKPMFNPIAPGYEIDWFAISLARPQSAQWHRPMETLPSTTAPQKTTDAVLPPATPTTSKAESSATARNDTSQGKRPAVSFGSRYLQGVISALTFKYARPLSRDESVTSWSVVTGDDTLSSLEAVEQPLELKDDTPAKKVLTARAQLGKLANWRSPITVGAVQLTEAIEAVMNTLIPNPVDSQTFLWEIPVRFEERTPSETIVVQIKWKNGEWKAPADRIEAVLSLWLYSVQSRREPKTELSRRKTTLSNDNDDLIRAKESPEGRGLRLFGTNDRKDQLLRDLRWWMPDGFQVPEPIEVWPVDSLSGRTEEMPSHSPKGKKISLSRCRVVGVGVKHPSTSTGNQSSDEPVEYRDTPHAESQPESDGKPRNQKIRITVRGGVSPSVPRPEGAEKPAAAKGLLAIESFEPLESLYVKDLFFKFMCAMAICPEMKLPADETEVVPQKTGDAMAKLKRFALHNPTLSALARKLHEAGMGDLHETFLSIIAPFSMHDRLPIGNLLIEHVRTAVKQFQSSGDFDKTCDSYIWLLDQATTLDKRQSQISWRALALTQRFVSEVKQGFQLAEKEDRLDDGDAFGADCLHTLFKKLPAWKNSMESTTNQKKEKLNLNLCLNVAAEFESNQQTVPIIPTGYLSILGPEPTEDEINRVRKFLEPSANCLGWTCWHYASVFGGEELETFLRGMPPDRHIAQEPDVWGWTPLHYACRRGNVAVSKKLLYFDQLLINTRGIDGVSPMHCAAKSGNIEIAKLLTNPVNVDDEKLNGPRYIMESNILRGMTSTRHIQPSRDFLGRHPVHWAAQEGHLGIVQLLMRDIDLEDYHGLTALHLAIIHDHTKLAQWLIQNVQVETLNLRDLGSRSPLDWAMRHDKGRQDIIRMIIERGADLSAGIGQDSPLYMAVAKNNLQLVNLLLEKGAQADELNSRNRTALHAALTYGIKVDIAESLLKADKAKHGKAITLEFKDTPNGDTPLHKAVETGLFDRVRFSNFISLIPKYYPTMDFNIANNDKETPLDVAKRLNASKIEQLIKEQIELQAKRRLEESLCPAFDSLDAAKYRSLA
jgi:ankyrin repeat protein